MMRFALLLGILTVLVTGSVLAVSPVGLERLVIDTTIPGHKICNVQMDRDLHWDGYTYEVYFEYFEIPQNVYITAQVKKGNLVLAVCTKNKTVADQMLYDLIAVSNGKKIALALAKRPLVPAKCLNATPFMLTGILFD